MNSQCKTCQRRRRFPFSWLAFPFSCVFFYFTGCAVGKCREMHNSHVYLLVFLQIFITDTKQQQNLILSCNNDGLLGFNLLSPLSLEHCLVHNNRVIRCTIPIAIIHNCSWLWRESCRWWFLVKPKPTMTIQEREKRRPVLWCKTESIWLAK